MDYLIYLEFEHAGVPYDVYQVRLATSDPSAYNYGIWDDTSQTAAVPWGTVVYPTRTGYYPYTLTLTSGHCYVVSWEIITTVGQPPVYRDDHIGPYFTVDDSSVRACTSQKGKCSQGTRSTFMLKVTDFRGNPVDAEYLTVEISDEKGQPVSLTNSIPEQVDIGYYVIDWVVDSNQTPGEYNIVWRYSVHDTEKAELQTVTVSSEADGNPLYYSGRVLEFKLALEHHLACAQSIPVYQEQSKISRDNSIFEFTFPRWNQCTGVKIYKNQNIVNEGVVIDYFKGQVTFDDALTNYDVVNADYNFKWFTDEQLYRYLNNAVQMLNIYPPASNYSLETIPDRFIPGVLYGAARDALRQLLMCLQFQQPQQVFGGSEAAQRAMQGFDSLKQNYEKDFDKILEVKKLGPYPKTRVTVTPEYTLPGGRSRWFRYLFKGA